MKILHVVHRYPPAIGGAETWCNGIARWQAGAGDEVRVLTLQAVRDDELWGPPEPHPSSKAVGACDFADGVRVRRCAATSAGSALTHILSRAGLAGFTRALSPELYGLVLREARWADVVHAHSVPGTHGYAAWLGARLARRPFVLTPHFQVGDPLHERPAVLWLLRRADRVFAVTECEAYALRRRSLPAERLTIVSNAADSEAGSPATASRGTVRAAIGVPADAALLCYLGRKSRAKGLDVLLDAFGLVRHRPHPVLALAGPSTEWYRGLLDSVRSAGLAHMVDLPALSAAEKIELLRAADLLILPSRREAFGIVFLEAWTAETAVLGADIDAVREVIGPRGYVFCPDDPRDLATSIDEILEHPAAAVERARSGLERVKAAHTWDRVGAAVSAAVESVVRESGARRSTVAKAG